MADGTTSCTDCGAMVQLAVGRRPKEQGMRVRFLAPPAYPVVLGAHRAPCGAVCFTGSANISIGSELHADFVAGKVHRGSGSLLRCNTCVPKES